METSETSIFQSHAVIYGLDGGDEFPQGGSNAEEPSWVLLSGDAWAELHIIHNRNTDRYRVISWIPGTQEVLVNIRINEYTTCTLDASDFGHLYCPNTPLRGISFAHMREASAFAMEVTQYAAARAAYKQNKDAGIRG